MKHLLDPNRKQLTRVRARTALLLLALVATVAYAHEGHAPLPAKGVKVDAASGLVTLSKGARDALDVRTVEVETANLPRSVLAYATLVTPWDKHAFVVSRLPGRIASLAIQPGQAVRAGDVIAEVESQELEQLKLEIQNAGTERKLTGEIHLRLKQSSGAISEREILNAELASRQAENALTLARTKWLALGLPPETLDQLTAENATPPVIRLPIRSPISGTAVHAEISVGKVVEPGEHLVEIVDLSAVWGRIGVLEKDIARVSVGQDAEVSLTGYPGQVFRSKVFSIGKSIDPESHLSNVWVEFQNVAGTEAKLLPGMTGKALLREPDTLTGTRVVPAAALVNNGVDQYVLVEEASADGSSEYRKRNVELLSESSGRTAIRSPELFPGDRVVTTGSHELGGLFFNGTLKLSKETVKAWGLKTEPFGPHPVSRTIEVPGQVEYAPDSRSVATTRLPGIVQSIRVSPGQAVKAGESLGEVFSVDFINMQLELLREELGARFLRDELERLKGTKNSISERRFIETEAASAASESKRASARKRLEIAGFSTPQFAALLGERKIVSLLPILSPLGGTLVRFERVVGQSVRADEPLFEIEDGRVPIVQGFVAENQLAEITIGSPVRMRTVSDPGSPLEGVIVRSGRTFNVAERALSIWVELKGTLRNQLLRNQMARLHIQTEASRMLPAVPLPSIHREGTKAFVFVLKDGVYERRAVELGRGDDLYVEVRSGLSNGEEVAATAVSELQTAWASVR